MYVGFSVWIEFSEYAAVFAQDLVDLSHECIIKGRKVVVKSVATLCITKLLVRTPSQHFATVIAGTGGLLI
jgi:hypothetical protein